MSNEITLTGSITINKPSVMSSAFSRAFTGVLRNMGGNFIVYDTMTVTTSALAIPLGSVTAPHWAFFLNMDPTNYIQLMNGASGAVFSRLLGGSAPYGDMALVPLDPACVPYAIANTANCQMEYAIASL